MRFKILLASFLFLAFTFNTYAEKVSQEVAGKVAINFFFEKSKSTSSA